MHIIKIRSIVAYNIQNQTIGYICYERPVLSVLEFTKLRPTSSSEHRDFNSFDMLDEFYKQATVGNNKEVHKGGLESEEGIAHVMPPLADTESKLNLSDDTLTGRFCTSLQGFTFTEIRWSRPGD